MADRSGFNKGAVLIDALRGETLEFALGVSGASANFALADDQDQTVLTHVDFPAGQDQVLWKLKFDPGAGQTVRITAADQQGNRLGTYQRDVTVKDADTQSLPVYATALLFVTAVGYTLKAGHLKQNGVKEQIVDVQYKSGEPTDKEAEPIGIDFA
jgi:hypothetical protein